MTLRWFDRRFAFDLPAAMFPLVVERLRGTPARIEDKVRGLSPEVLTRRDGDAWSIQEQVGHLLDLDELHTGRLDDFLAGAAVLRAADLTNRKTQEGGTTGAPPPGPPPPSAPGAEASAPAPAAWARGAPARRPPRRLPPRARGVRRPPRRLGPGDDAPHRAPSQAPAADAGPRHGVLHRRARRSSPRPHDGDDDRDEGVDRPASRVSRRSRRPRGSAPRPCRPRA